MIFWGMIAGGVIGGMVGMKNKLLYNWSFLLSSLFASYLSFVLSPLALDVLKDFKDLPQGVKNGAPSCVLFFVFLVVFCKIFGNAGGEKDLSEFLPEALEKLLSWGMGFLSGLLLLGMILFCATAVLPEISGESFEARQKRISGARDVAENILSAGRILTWSGSYAGKQSALLKKILPDPVEKKAEEPSPEKKKDMKKKVRKKRVQKNSPAVASGKTEKAGKKEAPVKQETSESAETAKKDSETSASPDKKEPEKQQE